MRIESSSIPSSVVMKSHHRVSKEHDAAIEETPSILVNLLSEFCITVVFSLNDTT